MSEFNYSLLSSSSDIIDLRKDLVSAAQKVLDEWQQDENGFDVFLGTGGACEEIAHAMNEVIQDKGLQFGILIDVYDEHSDITLVGRDGVWRLDIPWRIYEIHHGYCRWEKIEGVVLKEEDIDLELLSKNPKDCETFGIENHHMPELEIQENQPII